MPIETALRVQLNDRPGELAKVARQLANAPVNISSVAGLTVGGEGTVEFLVDDLGAAKRALTEGGITFQQVRVVVSPIPEGVPDHPGMLARMTEALAGAAINIESLYAAVRPDGQLQVVLGCSDPETAEPILASWGL